MAPKPICMLVYDVLLARVSPVHHLVDAPPSKIPQGPCERPFFRYGTVPTYTATVVLLKALTEHGVQILEVSVAHAVPWTERTVFHDGPYEFLPRMALPGNETPPTPSHGLACRGVLKKVQHIIQNVAMLDMFSRRRSMRHLFALELASALDGTHIHSFGRAIVMTREWEKEWGMRVI